MSKSTNDYLFVTIWTALWLAVLVVGAARAGDVDPVASCTTDTDCELAAEQACNDGRLEYCEPER